MGKIGSSRALAVATLVLLAPVFAELLASYLSDTGDLAFALFLIVFLAPLYGGAGLVIREVSLRTGRGWTGRLLLAAAFGVAMPTLVDGTLFTGSRSDAAGFDEAVTAAHVGGFPTFAALSWVIGHIVLSIAAPIAIAEGLFPRLRDRSWMHIGGVTVAAILAVGIAVVLRNDVDTVRASAGQALASVLVVLLFIALAFSPWGRPRRVTSSRAVPGLRVTAAAGLVAMLAFDLAPSSWWGVVQIVIVTGGAALLLSRWAPSARWTEHHIVAVAWGALAARSVIGFLVPIPEGVSAAAKFAQNGLLLALVALIGVALIRRGRRAAAGASAHVGPSSA